MVVYTHAVVCPGAMVVKSFDTFVAENAMLGPWSTYNLTVGAELDGINKLKQINELYVLLLLYIPWILARSNEPKHYTRCLQRNYSVHVIVILPEGVEK